MHGLRFWRAGRVHIPAQQLLSWQTPDPYRGHLALATSSECRENVRSILYSEHSKYKAFCLIIRDCVQWTQTRGVPVASAQTVLCVPGASVLNLSSCLVSGCAISVHRRSTAAVPARGRVHPLGSRSASPEQAGEARIDLSRGCPTVPIFGKHALPALQHSRDVALAAMRQDGANCLMLSPGAGGSASARGAVARPR